MNILIVGSGAIGTHLAYSLTSKENKIYLMLKKNKIQNTKKNGITLSIYDNKILKKKTVVKQTKNLKFIKNINEIKEDISLVVFSIKLKDYNLALKRKILPVLTKNTLIIPPCTDLPDWWFYKIFPNNNMVKKFFNKDFLWKNKINNIVGMTMWVSSVFEKNSFVRVRHIQRGYPIKQISKINKLKVDQLRKILKKKTISPNIQNVFAEIYLKAINSFAFNLIALDTELNNASLKKNLSAMSNLEFIFKEFDNIILGLKIPLSQTIKERIDQTLSSNKHTLSMLYDFQNRKKIEIKYLWRNLNFLAKITKSDISITKKIYKRVIKKIKKFDLV